ncbi:hypothetical protein EYF80_007401 [Liparis tanakae]|uniref:Uncharacterized protein n=1 Tax=Liparis tanakae TaxID=230148 RepID=A0A4Z2IWZ6_9TELE|nr:hypothetical protein EYF80_007401 [Liparis tanakae]
MPIKVVFVLQQKAAWAQPPGAHALTHSEMSDYLGAAAIRVSQQVSLWVCIAQQLLCCVEYTGAQLAMRDRWVSGRVEMGLLWTRRNGMREASPPSSHRPEGAAPEPRLCFLILSPPQEISDGEGRACDRVQMMQFKRRLFIARHVYTSSLGVPCERSQWRRMWTAKFNLDEFVRRERAAHHSCGGFGKRFLLMVLLTSKSTCTKVNSQAELNTH